MSKPFTPTEEQASTIKWLRFLADRMETMGAYGDAESVIVSFYKNGTAYNSEGHHKKRRSI